MGTIKATNIEPIADNGTVTLGSSGDQFTLATGAKSSFLYPAFEAYLSSDQTLTNATVTKVQFDTKVFDTDNCYDNSTNYRFTPTVAGKYYVFVNLKHQSSSADGVVAGYSHIYKNGSSYKRTQFNTNTHQPSALNVSVNGIIDMNGTTDYLEGFGYVNQTSGSPRFDAGSLATYFLAYRIGS